MITKLTERNIQDALFLRLHTSHHSICPNYTPKAWWECDVFAISKSGYISEFEIKLTKSDFKADAEKSGRTLFINSSIDRATKHEAIMAGDLNGPSKFTYVLPDGIINDEEVPEWAGIMRASIYHGRVVLTGVRQPKFLHKRKAQDHIIQHVRGVFYWRLWSERKRNNKAS